MGPCYEVLDREKISFEVWEDNQTCATIVRTGKTNELRHVHRVHGVNICALHDAYTKKLFALKDGHTKAQAADIFTKYFTDLSYGGMFVV